MTKKIQQTIATSEADRAFVKNFEEQTDMLANMVLEMVRDNPSYLLSPYMRKLLIEKAKTVAAHLRPIRGFLAADNLGPDLTPFEE